MSFWIKLSCVGILLATSFTLFFGVMVSFPTLLQLAERLPESSVFFSWRAEKKRFPAENGFLTLNTDGQQLGQLPQRADDLYRVYAELMENGDELNSLDVPEILDPAVDPDPELQLGTGPFDKPMQAIISEIWNGKYVTIGAALKFDLTFKERIFLAIQNMFSLAPENLLRNALGIHSFVVIGANSKTGIQHGLVQLHISDLENFFVQHCDAAQTSINICNRFNMSADNFIAEVQNVLGTLGDNFNCQLEFFWIQKGDTLILSNHENWVEQVAAVSQSPLGHALSLVVSKSNSSQLQFPYASQSREGDLSVGIHFNLKKLRTEFMQLLSFFADRTSSDGLILADTLQSPKGQELSAQAEDWIISHTRTAELFALLANVTPQRLNTQLWLYNSDISTSKSEFVTSGIAIQNSSLSALLPYNDKGTYSLNTQQFPLEQSPISVTRHGWSVLESHYLLSNLKALNFDWELLAARKKPNEF